MENAVAYNNNGKEEFSEMQPLLGERGRTMESQVHGQIPPHALVSDSNIDANPIDEDYIHEDTREDGSTHVNCASTSAAVDAGGTVPPPTMPPTSKGNGHARSINMRDVGDQHDITLKKGIIFRSSEIISGEDMQRYGIHSVIDLRRPPAACVGSARNIGHRLKRWISRFVVMFRHRVLRKKTKLQRTRTLMSEEALEMYPSCMRCSTQSATKYGVEARVYHVDLLPSIANTWIFYELPLYIKAKTMYMLIRGRQPDHMVAAAVADPQMMGYVKLYRIILKCSKKSIASALRLFLQPNNLPIIIHCQHGKDRTGLMVMILYLLCGVDRTVIVNDYAISEAKLREGRQNNELHGMPESLTTDTIIASAAEVMEQTIDFMESEFGGVVSYLTSAGMTEEEIRGIRSIICSHC